MSNLVVREDPVQLFQLYTYFGGNTARVSVVSRIPKERIDAMAHDFDWKGKSNGMARLDTDEGKELEREINRVSNYSLAARLSTVFDNIIKDLEENPEAARNFCLETEVRDGVTISTFNPKNLTELAKGIQLLADVKYRALGDKLAAEADTSSTMKGTTNLIVNVYQALQRRFDQNPRVDTATKVAEAVVEAHVRPATL